MRPGMTKRSLRSSASAPGGAVVPTDATRPSRTTTTALRTGSAPVPSKSVPQRIARTATSGAVDHDAVVAAGRLGGDVALADVAAHRLGIASGRRAPAASATGHDPHDLPGADRVLGGLAHVAHGAVGRGDLDAVHGPVG